MVNFTQHPLLSFTHKGKNCTAFGETNRVISMHSNIRISEIQCKEKNIQVRGYFYDKNSIEGALANLAKGKSGYVIYPQEGYVSLHILENINTLYKTR